MWYGIDQIESWQIMARFVDRFSRGAKPGDLPVEQPTKLYLGVNQTTLASLGPTLPQSVVAQVTEGIR